MLNFGALAIGSYFTASGASSDWYQNLNKAPWTPAGWVFGAAWTSIMICYSVYMAYLIKIITTPKKSYYCTAFNGYLTLHGIRFSLNCTDYFWTN